MNPFAWWDSLGPIDQGRILAMRKTVLLTLNTSGAFFVANAIAANAFADDVSFWLWLQHHWIVNVLAFLYASSTAAAWRKNDPINPSSKPPSP